MLLQCTNVSWGFLCAGLEGALGGGVVLSIRQGDGSKLLTACNCKKMILHSGFGAAAPAAPAAEGQVMPAADLIWDLVHVVHGDVVVQEGADLPDGAIYSCRHVACVKGTQHDGWQQGSNSSSSSSEVSEQQQP